MKTVNEDPHDFFKEGGWSFLSAQEDVSFSQPQTSLLSCTNTRFPLPAPFSRLLDRVNQRKDPNSKLTAMSLKRNRKKTLQSSVRRLQTLTLMLKPNSQTKEKIGRMLRKGWLRRNKARRGEIVPMTTEGRKVRARVKERDETSSSSMECL